MAYGTGWREGHPQGSGPSPAAIGTAVLGFLASFALGIVIGRGRSADQLFAPTAVRIAPQTAPAHLHGPVATGSVVPVTPPMPHYSRGRVPHADSAQAPGHARGGAPGSWGAAAVAAVMAPVAAVAAAAALVVAWRQRRAPLQTIEAPSALAMAASTGESRRSGGAGAADPSVRQQLAKSFVPLFAAATVLGSQAQPAMANIMTQSFEEIEAPKMSPEEYIASLKAKSDALKPERDREMKAKMLKRTAENLFMFEPDKEMYLKDFNTAPDPPK